MEDHTLELTLTGDQWAAAANEAEHGHLSLAVFLSALVASALEDDNAPV